MTKKVICLFGPTCSGKTQLALQLVEQFPCAIISVDSAMIYRGMDIGTAKPTPQELQRAPHCLINIRDPNETYSAADFKKDALYEITRIQAMGKIPLLVGGTMLYFHILQQGIAALPAADLEVRQHINQQAAVLGWQAMHDRLQKIDPQAAARIHPHDPQRLQRALEIYELTGKPLSAWIAEQENTALPYEVMNIGLLPQDRQQLHAVIATRFHAMLAAGFVAEVEQLYRRSDLHVDLPAIRCVGYRQIWQYLSGLCDYETMVERGIISTRQLAKRQMTWMRGFSKPVRVYDSQDASLAQQISAVLHDFVI